MVHPFAFFGVKLVIFGDGVFAAKNFQLRLEERSIAIDVDFLRSLADKIGKILEICFGRIVQEAFLEHGQLVFGRESLKRFRTGGVGADSEAQNAQQQEHHDDKENNGPIHGRKK